MGRVLLLFKHCYSLRLPHGIYEQRQAPRLNKVKHQRPIKDRERERIERIIAEQAAVSPDKVKEIVAALSEKSVPSQVEAQQAGINDEAAKLLMYYVLMLSLQKQTEQIEDELLMLALFS